MAKHRVFVLLDPDFEDDQEEIEEFFNRFGDAADFVRVPGDHFADDATNADIRAAMDGATITLVLNGRCTHSKRDVDWGVRASLEPDETGLPNGLLVCLIDRSAQKFDLGPALKANVDSGYARFYRLPLSVEELSGWLDDAAAARKERTDQVDRSGERLTGDAECSPTWSPFLDQPRR